MKKDMVLAIFIILSISLFPKALAAAEADTDSEYYKISAGDKIDVTVYEEADLTGLFEVKEDGTITYPLIGAVKAAGLTKKELEDKLGDLLRDGFLVDPYVRISIPKFGTRNIMILGNVAKPGAYPIPEDGNPTVLKAIVDSGGFTQMANIGGTRIIRTKPNGKKVTINPRVNEIIGGRRQDIRLEPGDLIVVPERLF